MIFTDWRSLLAYTVFIVFASYQFDRFTDLDEGKAKTVFALSGALAFVTAWAYLLTYAFKVSLLGAVLMGVFGQVFFMLLVPWAELAPRQMAYLAFVGWPASAYLMFVLLPL